MSAPRVAWPETRFAIGDRVRWRERDPDTSPGIVHWGPWIYGWVRYVYEDGTVRVRSDAGEDDDQHPDFSAFRNLELASAVDALAGLVP